MTVTDPLTASGGLQTLRTTLGWAPLEDRGWVAVTGADRVRWLNGMVTNNVQALKPGEGAYTFLLNAQGRIQGDATVWCSSEDLLLLETDLSQVEPMVALLDRFIIMDEVELTDVSTEWHGVSVSGQKSTAALLELGLPAPRNGLFKTSLEWRGHTLTLIHAYSPLVPRFEVWSRDSQAIANFTGALADGGIVSVSREALEQLRILEGTPKFSVDIREKDLPQETAQTRALHFNKGCYLGQEIVERIRSRGQVHRTFTQFVLNGDVPAPSTELWEDGKLVGIVTSIASEAVDGLRLALGYVRREAMERKLPLHYSFDDGGGTAEVWAEASTLHTASNA